MTELVAISTNKGGVLKTSITTHIAGVLARQGKKVLIVDADNQGNAFLSFGKNPDKLKSSLYEVLIEGDPADWAIQEVHKNIDILPSNDKMAFLDYHVWKDQRIYPNPFLLLKVALREHVSKYDVVLFDTPPNVGLALSNVLAMVDRVVIPFQPEMYSVRSLMKIISLIQDFKRDHNQTLEIAGVVTTLFDNRVKLHKQNVEQARKFCDKNGIRFFSTIIPRSAQFPNSIAYEKVPLTISKPYHPMSLLYKSFASEMMEEFAYHE